MTQLFVLSDSLHLLFIFVLLFCRCCFVWLMFKFEYFECKCNLYFCVILQEKKVIDWLINPTNRLSYLMNDVMFIWTFSILKNRLSCLLNLSSALSGFLPWRRDLHSSWKSWEPKSWPNIRRTASSVCSWEWNSSEWRYDSVRCSMSSYDCYIYFYIF